MVKATPPSILLKFQGRRDWPLEGVNDDWGLSPAQQESYVEQFRRILAAKNAWFEDQHDYYVLRRFLRARSYDLEKATTMWMNNLAWKNEFKVETILQDFYFDERDKFLTCYPQGYHKTDKMGRPIYIQLLGQVDVTEVKRVTTEERMIKFHIQEYERCVKVILPICSRLAGRNIDTTFGIMDVKGVGMSHLTGEVKRLLSIITKYDQDNYPEMLGRVCIINAPAVFRWIWAVVKNMLDPRTQGKIEILGTDYKPGLLKWVDIEALPDWLGGASKGSLIDDVGPWSDAALVAQLGLDVEELKRGRRPPPPSPHDHLYSHSHLGGGPGSVGRAPSVRRSGSSINTVLFPGDRAHGVVGGGVGVGAHSELGRTSDLLLHGTSDGYQSPLNSSGDLSGSRLGSAGPRFSSGLPQDVMDEAARRHGAAAGAPGSMVSTVGSTLSPLMNGQRPGAFGSIPERGVNGGAVGPDGKPRTLAERIAALERVLPQHLTRFRGAGTGGEGGPGVGASTRSAPEGSLLYRVEILEEALDALMAAQQLALEQQVQLAEKEAQLTAAQAALEQRGKPRQCCCCVM